MRWMIWSQLIHRRARTIALASGLLVASVSFTLLTSTVSTSQLRVIGTVAKNFRPAYDILVRPTGSFTPLEKAQGLIQSNYLSGVFGGISFVQYRQIKDIPGVEVAAPIANIGFIAPFEFVPIRINRWLTGSQVQLYRLRFDWEANGGLSSYPDSDQYVYFTPRYRFVPDRGTPGGIQQIMGGARQPICSGFIRSRPPEGFSPFQLSASTSLFCFSGKTPQVQGGVIDFGPLPGTRVGALSTVFFPLLITAIDPAAEQALLGLDDTVVSGRPLSATDAPKIVRVGTRAKYRVVPVMASATSFLDETLRVTVDRLRVPADGSFLRDLSSKDRAFDVVRRLRGETVGRLQLRAASLFERYVKQLESQPKRLQISYSGYWQASSTRYQQVSPNRLRPLPVRNDSDLTFSTYYGAGWAPWENRDRQYRKLTYHRGSTTFTNNVLGLPALQVVGRFDPALLPGFSRLSQVPLETYYPPRLQPANTASIRALHGRPLLPTQNIGGYISQPPFVLTTMRGLKAFTNPAAFEGADSTAPISAIRVRVSGVTGPDEASRERIRLVAEEIRRRTGLAVDITAGSSPQQMLIELPPGKFGAPELLLREGWVRKGVAVRYLDAVDQKSLALFSLILLLSTLFLMNATLASVRTRRKEVGVLLCMGWSRRQIFRAILGEVAVIGVASGLMGTAIAFGVARALSLHVSILRASLVAPVALGLAVVAGLIPAWRASRGHPMEAVLPVVGEPPVRVRVRTIASMAANDVLRVPSRTLLGASGLILGIAALTVLVAIDAAFQEQLVGTLLGRALSLRVRGADALSLGLTIALAGISVSDVVFVSLRERAAEFATLRTSGWSPAQVKRLVFLEGFATGLLGSLTGALLGIGTSSLIRGVPLNKVWAAAAIAGATGTLVSVIASLPPVAASERMMPTVLLAEE